MRFSFFLRAIGIPLLCVTAPTWAQSEPSPKPSLSESRELLLTGSYKEAMDGFENLSKEERTRVHATIGLAETKIRVGQYKEASDLLESLDAPRSARRLYLLAQVDVITGHSEQAVTRVREVITIEPNHAGARLLLGRIHEMHGRTKDAVESYKWFDDQIVRQSQLPKDPAWLTDTGLGFLRYSVLTGTAVATRTQHVLTEMLQVAYTRLDRAYWPARIAAADLLREKYNNDEEDGSVSDYFAALKINPRLPEAHVGLGEVALAGWRFEEVEHRAELAREINPNYPPAHHLLAGKFILERRYDQAITEAEKALAINPNDLTALSLIAAGHECKYDAIAAREISERVAKINPRSSLFHRTVGDALSGIRQYAASEKHYLLAMEYDPVDANARTELGMMYMQWGDETKARDALEAAWTLDPYNERTKFTLELLERLHKFAKHETDHFIIRYDAEKDPGLGEYVAEYLESIFSSVTGDFSTNLDEKTIIEFFPTHKAFAVRITGKPWIYTVGASTGRVIALTAPRHAADAFGQYNLARVLKHEFVHTVTLAATENRIPHWFTEGLAVYQEDAARSMEWAELLTDAMRRDQLFTLESIDWGFIRPKRSGDRQMAYAQSEWMVEFIIDRYGYDVIPKMLRRYAGGATQKQVLRELMNVDLSEFDADFAKWSRKDVGQWPCAFDLISPDDVITLRNQAEADDSAAELVARLARAEFDVAEYQRAEDAARRALEKNPVEPTALEVLVRLFAYSIADASGERKQNREDEALPYIDSLLKLDSQNRVALKLRAQIALRREENDRARQTFEALHRVCSMDPAAARGLAGIHLAGSNPELALPHLLELARIEQTDPDIPKKVADIIRSRGNLAEAAYWYRQAIFIDPFDVKLHESLGGACLQSADYPCALREYEMLTKLDPTKAGFFESAAIAAHKGGNAAAARRHADAALKLNPASNIGQIVQTADP